MARREGIERIGRTISVYAAKRSCLDKRRYPSRNHARDAAARNLKRGWGACKPYQCSICGGWHLTTIRPALKAA
jgi:hypothetical protein